MYLINLFFEKKVKLLSATAVIALLLVYYQSGYIMENYILMIGGSDSGRILGWSTILDGTSALELLMGSQVGQNTGLFLGGITKNGGGDSFLIGTLNDFGLFGLVMFLWVFFRSVFTSNNLRYSTIYGILISFVLMTFVNSGFEKLLVMLSYSVALIIIRNNPVQGIVQTATPKHIVTT